MKPKPSALRQTLPRWHKPNRNEDGFSLLEVLVSILISVITVSIVMQMFVTAAFLRSRANHFNDAYNWIQSDFERVRLLASKFEGDKLPYSSYCGASLASGLSATFIADNSQGLGGNNVTVGTKALGSNEFSLVRKASYASTAAPDRLVALEYELLPVSGGDPVLEIDAEVVLYAAFQCP